MLLLLPTSHLHTREGCRSHRQERAKETVKRHADVVDADARPRQSLLAAVALADVNVTDADVADADVAAAKPQRLRQRRARYPSWLASHATVWPAAAAAYFIQTVLTQQTNVLMKAPTHLSQFTHKPRCLAQIKPIKCNYPK